jgi:hypothetical protein
MRGGGALITSIDHAIGFMQLGVYLVGIVDDIYEKTVLCECDDNRS